MAAPTGPTADVSVRVAWADDADAIAAVQVSAWAVQYADVLPAGALPDDPAPVAEAWRASLGRPADARQRALVALERNRVVGFAVTGPAGDPDCDPVADGEVGELVVLPDEQGKGHGSRLLQACAETLQADRFTRAVTWTLAGDDDRRAFFTGAGWAPDTAHRELDLDGSGETTVKQVRLHTALA
ncbi:GNAT family N-acetyltransferase [Nocardioides litoris]|uniref:GNAT family N-acetyltransferase n=1 Tax=Nocardioides litoris TaxID=1926648 RepID=UPI00111EEA9C|nr:GNAT family N-acetyltransferase [Nocardioides litoris]